MRAPSFWYKPRGLRALSLLPLSLLYRLGRDLRKTRASPTSVDVPVICIGNIVTGGVGKTPVALTIAEILKTAGKKPHFVTRGYGGREQGPHQVDLTRDTAHEVGDEALLLARIAPVWVGKDRAATLKAAAPLASHLILDDGLQNPNLKPDLSLLVIDGERGVGNGWLLPAGPLRETLHEVKGRIDAAIIIGKDDIQKIKEQLNCPILLAHWQPQLTDDVDCDGKYFAFSGIGRPEKFYGTCREAGLTLCGTKDFPDHHLFKESELTDLEMLASSQNAKLLTTEKDWVRLEKHWHTKISALKAKLVFDDVETLSALLNL